MQQPDARSMRWCAFMNRAVLLKMSEQAVLAHCKAKDIGISSLGKIPAGGVRLVCMSSDGAERIRAQLKSNLMKEDTQDLGHGPGWDFVPRD